MKKFIICLLIMCSGILYIGCKEDNITNSNVSLPINELSGVIENWQSGRMNLKVIAYYEDEVSHWGYSQTIDSTYINADKSFKVRLNPPIINSRDSFNFPYNGNCSGNITVTPNCKFKSLTLEVYNQNDSVLGFIQKSDADTNLDPQNIAFFIYNNQNAVLSGEKTCNPFSNIIITTSYNWSALKGWNPIYLVFNQIDSTHYKEDYSNNQPSNLRWRYKRYIIFDSQSNILYKKTE